eukprot:GCRY01001768.1.p1 GENE.GCRY01001768.1~~GCRY01001768.1.p1  ORF type:complete len:381 (+),score=54.18 GCRY01001768.1:189-1331(+)
MCHSMEEFDFCPTKLLATVALEEYNARMQAQEKELEAKQAALNTAPLSPVESTASTYSQEEKTVQGGELSTSPSEKKKPRKPYVLRKARETWTENEHLLFLKGLQFFKRDWKQIQELIGTKTVVQVRSHAQKHFEKLKKLNPSFVPALRKKHRVSKVDSDSESERSVSKDELKLYAIELLGQLISKSDATSHARVGNFVISLFNENETSEPHNLESLFSSLSQHEQDVSRTIVTTIAGSFPSSLNLGHLSQFAQSLSLSIQVTSRPESNVVVPSSSPQGVSQFSYNRQSSTPCFPPLSINTSFLSSNDSLPSPTGSASSSASSSCMSSQSHDQMLSRVLPSLPFWAPIMTPWGPGMFQPIPPQLSGQHTQVNFPAPPTSV